MRVNQVSSQSFGHVFNTKHVDRIARRNREFSQELRNIRKILKDEELDSLKNVDIILHHSEEMNGFYGVISSKKQGVPNIDGYRCKVTSSKNDIGAFGIWARAWDDAYSPDESEKISKLKKAVTDYIRHNKQ